MPTTFWFPPLSEGGRARAVPAESTECARELLPDATTVPVAMSSHPTCSTCPYLTDCESSAWNEGRSVEFYHEHNLDNITCVHTCRTCFKRSLTSWKDGRSAACREVPDACPRWQPHSGSALDCDGCMSERENLRRAHPASARRAAAAGRFFEGVVRTARARREPVVDLDKTRAHREAVHEMAEASSPFTPEVVHEIEARPEVAERLAAMLDAMLSMALRHQVLAQEWARIESAQQTLFCVEWIEALALAAIRHETVEAIVHEWMLAYTDKPPASRGWVRLSVPQRRMLIRSWECVVRDIIPTPSPA